MPLPSSVPGLALSQTVSRKVCPVSIVPSDIAIAQAATLRPIADVAAEVGLAADEIIPYGKYKAKISAEAIRARSPRGKLVLVTGINPTPAGEGKSTVTVGVSQALRRLGKKVMVWASIRGGSAGRAPST